MRELPLDRVGHAVGNRQVKMFDRFRIRVRFAFVLCRSKNTRLAWIESAKVASVDELFLESMVMPALI